MTARKRKFLMFVVVPLLTAGVLIGMPFVFGGRFVPVFLLPVIGICLMALVHGFTLPADYLAKWAKAHGITVTDQNRGIVRRYLLRGRRIRAAGALVGYISFQVYDVYQRGADLPFGWITATFAGYLLGAAVAEFWAMRPERGTVRAASLTPRVVTDYLPRGAVIGLRGGAVAAALAAASWPLIENAQRGLFVGAEPRPELGSVIFWAAGAAVLAVFVEVTARRVARRPQPVSSDEVIVVDDAIRSTALHGLYGAGLALTLGAVSRILNQLGWFNVGSRLNALLFVLSLITGLASIFAWLHLGIDQEWIVRRSRRNEPVAA